MQGEAGFDALDIGEIGGDRADLGSDTDASGTGERGAAVHDTDIAEGADISPDRIVVVGGGGIEESDVVDVATLASDASFGTDDEDEDDPEGG